MKRKLLERDITKAIRDFLKIKGIFHWKVHQGLGSAPGVSDIIGIAPGGKLLALEIKVPGRAASEAQKRFLANVEAAGGIAILAYGVEDVIEGLGFKDQVLF